MPAIRAYATLAQIRTRQGIGSGDTADDARLLAKLRAATAEIEAKTARVFQPLKETRLHDYEDSQCLRLRGELLSLTSMNDGAGTVDSTAIILLGDYETTYGPYYALEVDGAKAFLSYLTTKTRAISVVGIWGWHDDYANAWHDTTITVAGGGINSSVTSITTGGNPTTATHSWGQTPAISAGHLIQIASEGMYVIATNATTLTVIRAANGTTAASHNATTPISVYEPPRDIQDICARWAAWLYKQDDVPFGTSVIFEMGRTITPAALPADLAGALDPYQKARVG